MSSKCKTVVWSVNQLFIDSLRNTIHIFYSRLSSTKVIPKRNCLWCFFKI